MRRKFRNGELVGIRPTRLAKSVKFCLAGIEPDRGSTFEVGKIKVPAARIPIHDTYNRIKRSVGRLRYSGSIAKGETLKGPRQ